MRAADGHQHPRIGVAIGGPSTELALRAYESIADRAGIAELRLDLFTEPPDLPRLIASRPCPLVVTCRASIEGGKFSGPEEQRLDILRESASLGAELVDIERFAFHKLGPVAPARVIVSQHDFSGMPRELGARWRDIRALGADVVKVAGMADDAAQLLPVLDVLAGADVPTIAMAMAPAGVASRIVALRYERCVLTYASLDRDVGTAPGQISLGEMHEIYRASTITESTRFYGLVAPAVSADLLATYNRLLVGRRVDAICVPLPTSRADVRLLRALLPHAFAGFHLHGPSQQSLKHQLDDVRIAGSAELNSVSTERGRLVGEHVSSPDEQVDRWLEQAG